MMNVKLSQQKFTIDNNNCSKLHYQLIQMKFLTQMQTFAFVLECEDTSTALI